MFSHGRVEAGLHAGVFAVSLLAMSLSFALWSIEMAAVLERLLIIHLKVSVAT